MNGRYTIIKDFGIELDDSSGYPIGIPTLPFKLPDNNPNVQTRQLLEVKFRKWKVCDENGNIKEAWFLSTAPFDLPT